MNLILNRNFELPEDGWYQLAPLGEFPHAAAGVTQVIDEAACNRMVAAFETIKNAADNFPGLLIDFDHFSFDAADSPIAGVYAKGNTSFRGRL